MQQILLYLRPKKAERILGQVNGGSLGGQAPATFREHEDVADRKKFADFLRVFSQLFFYGLKLKNVFCYNIFRLRKAKNIFLVFSIF